jgi:hypothetical protein
MQRRVYRGVVSGMHHANPMQVIGQMSDTALKPNTTKTTREQQKP